MSDHTVYSLSRLADVSAPDSADSPGARWLINVQSAASELLTDCERLGGDPIDAIHETADATVPTYTHERWLVFVDLCAYNVDTEGYGAPRDPDDMTERAGTALYVVAERLLYALVEESRADDDA